MKITKTYILEQLKLNKVWNKTSIVCGVNIATVMWDSKPWKVIHPGTTFNTLTKTKEVEDNSFQSNFNFTYRKRIYKPIKEFKYQSELADYIKEVNIK